MLVLGAWYWDILLLLAGEESVIRFLLFPLRELPVRQVYSVISLSTVWCNLNDRAIYDWIDLALECGSIQFAYANYLPQSTLIIVSSPSHFFIDDPDCASDRLIKYYCPSGQYMPFLGFDAS